MVVAVVGVKGVELMIVLQKKNLRDIARFAFDGKALAFISVWCKNRTTNLRSISNG